MENTSEDLGRLVARGDAGSHEALLRAVRPAVLRYALARGVPDHDAQDLAQETCLGVLSALPNWRDTGRPVWALVFTIARNKLADRARAHAAGTLDLFAEVPVGLVDPTPGPAELLDRADGVVWVRDVLLTLPETQRDVLLLRAIVGLSTAETAGALSLTVGSVRVLQHRAVVALRRQLVIAPEGAS